MTRHYTNPKANSLYKTSIRMALAVVIAMSCFIGHAKAQDCYNKNRSNGVTAMRNKEYKKAIKWFEVAKKCPDKPENNDLQSRIDECKDLIQAAEKKIKEEKERDKVTKKDGKDNNQKDVKDLNSATL